MHLPDLHECIRHYEEFHIKEPKSKRSAAAARAATDTSQPSKMQRHMIVDVCEAAPSEPPTASPPPPPQPSSGAPSADTPREENAAPGCDQPAASKKEGASPFVAVPAPPENAPVSFSEVNHFPSVGMVTRSSHFLQIEESTGPSDEASGSRPFQCTIPGCNKNYKNSNGLKYHITHGHDSLSVSSDLDKPFVCTVPGCGRRYKNSNGLKYHFAHGRHADPL